VDTDKLGAKLGPRLADLMAKATIATRQNLTDHEVKLRTHSAWTTITQMGNEAASFLAPFRAGVLGNDKAHPEFANWFERITSGRNQIESLITSSAVSTATGTSVGALLANYLAPTLRVMIGADPQVDPAVADMASLAAKGIDPKGYLAGRAKGQGINGAWFESLTELASSYPDPGSANEMLNRGALDYADYQTALTRAGVPVAWQAMFESLRHALRSGMELAENVARGIIGEAEGRREAAKGGWSADQFAEMIESSHAWLPLEAVNRLRLRGKMTEAQFSKALKRLGLAPEQADLAAEAAIQPPSPAEVLNGWLEGQITEETAKRRWAEGGGDPTWLQDAYNSSGQAPTPMEAIEMLRRGIIPREGVGPHETSYHQAFLEGPWRNKWLEPFLGLAEYLPPPRTVTALVRSGAISEALGLELLKKQGLRPELAAAYVVNLKHETTAKHRDLTIAQIETAYESHELTEAEALSHLRTLGYSDEDANVVLTASHTRRVVTERSRAISAVRKAYLDRELVAADARTQLVALGMDVPQVEALLPIWDVERALDVRRLTPAQVVHAVKVGLMEQGQGEGYLAMLGYGDFEVSILLPRPETAA